MQELPAAGERARRSRGRCAVTNRRAKFPSLEGRGQGRDSSTRRGFTLVEIVLALALTSVITYLLMTAVELFLVRIETSRGRVESSQVARTILDQMADDVPRCGSIRPAAASAGQAGGTGVSQQGGGASQQGGGASAGQGVPAGQTGGGSAQQLPEGKLPRAELAARAVRAAVAQLASTPSPRQACTASSATSNNCESIARPRRTGAPRSREVDPTEPAAVSDFPRTVRYFLSEGTSQTSQESAKQGVTVQEEATTRPPASTAK